MGKQEFRLMAGIQELGQSSLGLVAGMAPIATESACETRIIPIYREYSSSQCFYSTDASYNLTSNNSSVSSI